MTASIEEYYATYYREDDSIDRGIYYTEDDSTPQRMTASIEEYYATYYTEDDSIDRGILRHILHRG